MPSLFEISEVVVHDAVPTDRILGLECFASCRIGPYRFDSIQVRRHRDGGHFVKWPAHKDAAGYEHPYLEVADITIRPAVHQALETAVLAVARKEGRIP